MFPGSEAVRRQNLGDAPGAALDHAVGRRMIGLDHAMLDVMLGTPAVEGLFTGGVTLTGGAAAVGERLAVVGEDLVILKGAACRGLARKAWAQEADFSGYISAETQRVARSIAANR